MLLNIKALRAAPGKVMPIEAAAELRTLSYRGRQLPLTGPVLLAAQAVYRKETGIHVSMDVHAGVIEECSRCLQELVTPIALHEEMEFRPETSTQIFLEEEAFVYPSGTEELDLLPYAIGLIVSELEIKPLCKLDCKGLCSHCGHNLNDGPCACPAETGGDPRLRVLKELLR